MGNPCGNDKCNEINAGIDKCIQPLVKALNDAGLETVASCCGHGHRPGNIALRDGREIIIAPDYESGRKIDVIFPNIHGEVRPSPEYLQSWLNHHHKEVYVEWCDFEWSSRNHPTTTGGDERARIR